ncbi:MAG: BrnA antitoxin family protein [Acidobacteriia bacterium]|nr:BrnA antitoxin family protein [Terriglobia bacterium]
MKLTNRQAKQIRTLKRMKDEDIDFTDIPEMRGDEKLIVGKFYRPIKKSLTIRIDADVLAWLRGQGKGYQTRINGYLREAMHKTKKQPRPVSTRKNRSAS